MTDKEIINFLEFHLWSLQQTQSWPPKRLEFADNHGVLRMVEGSDIREMVKVAILSYDLSESGFRSVATAIRNSYQLTGDKIYACVDMERHIRELAEKLFVYRDEFNDFDRDDLF